MAKKNNTLVIQKTQPELNEEVMLGVADAIEREPDLYSQATTPRSDCGAPCCLAGWAPWVKGGTKLYSEYFLEGGFERPEDALIDSFGVTIQQAGKLYLGDWPLEDRKAYIETWSDDIAWEEGTKLRASAAANMLRGIVERNRRGEPLGI